MLFREYNSKGTTIKWYNDYIPKNEEENKIAVENLNSTIERLLLEISYFENKEN